MKLGRPLMTVNKIPDKVIKYFQKYRRGELTKTDYAKLCGISRPTLDKYIALMTDK